MTAAPGMVEKVARAIANAHGDAWDDVPDSKAEWTERRGEFGNRFRGVDENFKDDYRDEARAAIEAMREPSSEQERRMEIVLGPKTPPTRRWHWVWQEMIDAALQAEPALSPALDKAIQDELDHPPASIVKGEG